MQSGNKLDVQESEIQSTLSSVALKQVRINATESNDALLNDNLMLLPAWSQ